MYTYIITDSNKDIMGCFSNRIDAEAYYANNDSNDWMLLEYRLNRPNLAPKILIAGNLA